MTAVYVLVRDNADDCGRTVSGTYCSKIDQTIHLSGPEGWPEVTR